MTPTIRRWVAICAAVAIGFGGLARAETDRTPSHAVGHPPSVGARAALLMDARTGAILYEKNAFRQLDPASLTKIMTAILTIEHGHLMRVVTITPRAAATIGSRMHLTAGQQYTVMDLLKGLLLRSGNDAAVALAQANAGSVDRFVAQMDQEAQELGAYNTTFENPHGLTAPGHYSSAYDLAVVARAALRMPTFQQIVASKEATITNLANRRTRVIHNTNRLLYSLPGADGVKTGTTNAAGKCLVASVTRAHRQLLAVILDSPDRWQDAARLLNWGFAAWRTVEAVRAGQVLARVPVRGGVADAVALTASRTVWISEPADQPYRLTLSTPRWLTAPVGSGAVGSVVIAASQQPAKRISLRPARPIAQKPPPHQFWDWLQRLLQAFNFGDGTG
ncbi:MAG: D-alanyl-D-alanine carboxypeptidase [Thermaerobacter sp.]|nr:D-alanyl-D-alanine carboxypeptidase [Thermaerobacter sp.]